MNDPKAQFGKRFKTAKEALDAIRTGDFSKALPYGGKEWENAYYEFGLICNPEAIHRELKQSRERHTKSVNIKLP
jgi:hypothetical protein